MEQQAFNKTHNLNESIMAGWVDMTAHLNRQLVGKGKLIIERMAYDLENNKGIIQWAGDHSPFGADHLRGTHAFSVHPDGSPTFYSGHYDLSKDGAAESFSTRVGRGHY